MSKRKDKETIKKEVLENMRNNGAMNHLQSLYISNIASLVKSSNGLDYLKPYKTIKTEKPYLIASQIVIQYFQKKSMNFSLSTITDESDDVINFSNSSLVVDALGMDSDGFWLNDLLSDWNSVKSTIIQKNKFNFFKKLRDRLDEVLPENEKYVKKDTNQPISKVVSNQDNQMQSSKSKKAAPVQPVKGNQENLPQSQSSAGVFSKSEDDINDIQINDEDTDNDFDAPSNTDLPNTSEQTSNKDNSNLAQPLKKKQGELTQSQSSTGIFSKSEDDIQDIQINDEDTENEFDAPSNNENSTKPNIDTNININVKPTSQSDVFDVDVENESESEKSSKTESPNNNKSVNNTNKADVPVETDNFSDNSFDELIEINSNGSEDSFHSPDKKNINSKAPQLNQKQDLFASSSVSATPQAKTPTSTPIKSNIVSPVTPTPIEDEFGDFDDDDDIEILGADKSSNQPSPKSPEKQKAPQKQETKAETPNKDNDSLSIDVNNDDDMWSDSDTNFSNE